MKKIMITGLCLIALSLGSMSQVQKNQQVAQQQQITQQQQQSYQTYGYCLTGIEMTPEVQAKVTKMQAQHQAEMVPLRTKLRSTRDWTIKTQVRAEMDTKRLKHQQEIWALVPAAKNNALNLRLGQGRGQGYPGLGQGRGAGRGAGQGYGRFAGRGAGRGAAALGGGRRWR